MSWCWVCWNRSTLFFIFIDRLLQYYHWINKITGFFSKSWHLWIDIRWKFSFLSSLRNWKFFFNRWQFCHAFFWYIKFRWRTILWSCDTCLNCYNSEDWLRDWSSCFCFFILNFKTRWTYLKAECWQRKFCHWSYMFTKCFKTVRSWVQSKNWLRNCSRWFYMFTKILRAIFF